MIKTTRPLSLMNLQKPVRVKKAKEYKFNIPDELLNCLTEKNLENFIEGFSDALRKYMELVKYSREISDVRTGKNTDYVKSRSFTYIDDGTKENKVTIHICPDILHPEMCEGCGDCNK